METTRPFDRLDYLYKLFIVLALGITGLILASDIIVPMAYAAILAVVMRPLVIRLERKKLPTGVAITLVLLVTIIILALLGWLVITQLVNLANDLPNLESRFQTFADGISTYLRDTFNISTSDQNKLLTDLMKSASGYVGNLLVSTSNALSTFIQVPIYIFLFLIYRDKFRKFFLSLLPDNKDISWRKDIEGVVQGYISGLMLVTLIVATLNTVGLLIVGIEHAIFFGLLSGVLTIIPYVGIIIGALFPIVMALITKDSIWYAVGVIIVFSIVQFLEGNFISPRITGSKVSINALAAIVALLVGGKIMGIAGMILAVPAIGIVKVLLPHTKHLKPFAILIDDEKETGDDQLAN
jgi:predicted PurR-regulated permease PerM